MRKIQATSLEYNIRVLIFADEIGILSSDLNI